MEIISEMQIQNDMRGQNVRVLRVSSGDSEAWYSAYVKPNLTKDHKKNGPTEATEINTISEKK